MVHLSNFMTIQPHTHKKEKKRKKKKNHLPIIRFKKIKNDLPFAWQSWHMRDRQEERIVA